MGQAVVQEDPQGSFDFVQVGRVTGIALTGLGKPDSGEAVAGFADEDVQDDGGQGVGVRWGPALSWCIRHMLKLHHGSVARSQPKQGLTSY